MLIIDAIGVDNTDFFIDFAEDIANTDAVDDERLDMCLTHTSALKT